MTFNFHYSFMPNDNQCYWCKSDPANFIGAEYTCNYHLVFHVSRLKMDSHYINPYLVEFAKRVFHEEV